MQGSFLIVEGSRAEIDAFAEADPYRTAGLFRSTTISEWIWAVIITLNPDRNAWAFG